VPFGWSIVGGLGSFQPSGDLFDGDEIVRCESVDEVVSNRLDVGGCGVVEYVQTLIGPAPSAPRGHGG
jgi:hypothetical protein